jgi:signal peptidase I
MSRARYTFYSIVIVCCLILLYLFLVRGMDFFLVPSASMEPLLVKGDYILTFKAEEYGPGDVVVFDDPINKGEFMVKRIVAVGGDDVELVGGALHLNGHYVSEPYVKEPLFLNTESLTVPAGCCFVMGDNRQQSEDSSSEDWHAGEWECSPCVDMSTIVGKVHRIYLPLDRWGPVKSATLQTYPLPQQQP